MEAFATTVDMDNQIADRSALSTYEIDHSVQLNAGDVIDDGMVFAFGVTVLFFSAFARVSPQGGDYQFTMTKNGVEVGPLLTVRAGEVSGSVDVSGVMFAATDELGLKVKAAPGGQVQGQNLKLRVQFQKTT